MADNDEWKAEERTYTIFPKHMEPEDYLKILLCEDVLFINNGWYDKTWPEDRITVHVGCNDIFAWGCADSEDISYSELADLYEMWVKDPDWGPAVWCIKKRKQMPQAPVYRDIKAAGIWDLDSMGLN